MKNSKSINANPAFTKVSGSWHFLNRINALAFIFFVKQQRLAFDFLRACL